MKVFATRTGATQLGTQGPYCCAPCSPEQRWHQNQCGASVGRARLFPPPPTAIAQGLGAQQPPTRRIRRIRWPIPLQCDRCQSARVHHRARRAVPRPGRSRIALCRTRQAAAGWPADRPTAHTAAGGRPGGRLRSRPTGRGLLVHSARKHRDRPHAQLGHVMVVRAPLRAAPIRQPREFRARCPFEW